jgi:glucuronoarabinoxylan endo-1,4-beta-xylanase
MNASRSALVYSLFMGAGMLAGSSASVVTVNTAQTYQTMDGFGAFGGRDAWWMSSSASYFYNDDWLTLMIDSLGMTIWRNEYFPPSDQLNTQDANWAKQLPLVQAMKSKADRSGVPLKFLVSLWTPPASMKCAGTHDTWGAPTSTPHQYGTKQGGVLCAASQSAFAAWLVAGLQMHRDAGVEVYALSMQNEPAFVQGYNSCFYDYTYYRDVLKAVGPTVKAAFPNVKFLGAEHMLGANIYNNVSQFPYIYEKALIQDAQSHDLMDIWAYHGYADGVNPTPNSEMVTLWRMVKDSLHKYDSNPIWMTETSGYSDTWTGTRGAEALAFAMFTGLYYGDMAGWVWWLAGYSPAGNTEGLVPWSGGRPVPGKRFYASRQFYRFIRPGAQRVSTTFAATDSVYAAAFRHQTEGTFSIVLLNMSGRAQDVTFAGSTIPASYAGHRTSATENSVPLGTVNVGSGVTLPAHSVTTLYNQGATGALDGAIRHVRTSGVSGNLDIYSLSGRLVARTRALATDGQRVLCSGTVRSGSTYVLASHDGCVRSHVYVK